MNLYYDTKTQKFGTEKSESSECVFETYDKYDTSRIGWKKGINPPIKKGNLKLVIATNFWPENVSCEFFHANIYINDVLLLPLSKCYSGSGSASTTPKNTIAKNHDNFEWTSFLSEVCEICNHTDAWLNDELEKLLVKLSHESSNFEKQISVLKTIRLFDGFNPYYEKKYRTHFDSLLFDANNVCPELEKVFNENNENSIDIFDTIWNYIKDYKLSD